MISSISRSFSRVTFRTVQSSINQPLNRTLQSSFTRTFTQSTSSTADDDYEDDFDKLFESSSESLSAPAVEQSTLEAGKWSDLLDPNNPPRLSVKHYEMLTKLAGRKPQVAVDSLDPVLDESIINMHRMLATLSSAAPELKRETAELGALVEEQYRVEAARLATPPPAPVRPRSVKLPCRFCAIRKRAAEYPELKLEYTNLSLLHRFINLRGMIYPRRVTGNCMKHQRKLANAVKRARFIGLLSYTSNWSVDGLASLESMIEAIPDLQVTELHEMSPAEEFFEQPIDSFHPQDFTPNNPNALPNQAQ